jgi:hypothetical protein
LEYGSFVAFDSEAQLTPLPFDGCSIENEDIKDSFSSSVCFKPDQNYSLFNNGSNHLIINLLPCETLLKCAINPSQLDCLLIKDFTFVLDQYKENPPVCKSEIERERFFQTN